MPPTIVVFDMLITYGSERPDVLCQARNKWFNVLGNAASSRTGRGPTLIIVVERRRRRGAATRLRNVALLSGGLAIYCDRRLAVCAIRNVIPVSLPIINGASILWVVVVGASKSELYPPSLHVSLYASVDSPYQELFSHFLPLTNSQGERRADRPPNLSRHSCNDVVTNYDKDTVFGIVFSFIRH
ncbi:hypothetical protein EVAR_5856_1 [Eumeta japonica]|uniref:Uncharacterized protein n=1 Tax=Eumeta variegata TaxID=151549 RepID=A0A4C1TBV3_EUMVA|nr:hypothetical protein EVAR_5856_1 [Eumeta japonica]